MDGGAWWAAVHEIAKSQTQLSDFTFTFHFHALEKELATHSSVLAWRIPGTGEPGGLPSLGSHRVGHDWSDLAAAAGKHKLIRYLTHYHSPQSILCFLVYNKSSLCFQGKVVTLKVVESLQFNPNCAMYLFWVFILVTQTVYNDKPKTLFITILLLSSTRECEDSSEET